MYLYVFYATLHSVPNSKIVSMVRIVVHAFRQLCPAQFFSVLSPECRGIKVEKKGFDQIAAHLKLLTSIPSKSVHCQV